jgi:hypothetical protein
MAGIKMLKRTFTIDLTDILKSHIHDGDLRNARFLINEIQVGEIEAFYKMLDDFKVESIDGIKLLKKDSIFLLCEKNVRASKSGFPEYLIFKEVIGSKRFIKFKSEFFEFKIDAFIPVPEGEDERNVMLKFIASEIYKQDESMLRMANAMDAIENNKVNKLNYFQALVMKRFWNSWRGKDSDIDSKKTYTFRQLICVLDASPIVDNYHTLNGKALKIVSRLTDKKHLHWEGFGMPELGYRGYGAEYAPECWFCPKSSWLDCPKRSGEHENNGDFTIDDVMIKYKQVAEVLGNRASGIGDTINGEIESVRFEYQVIARFDDKVRDLKNNSSGGSYGDSPTGLYIQADEKDAQETLYHYDKPDRSEVPVKLAAQIQSDIMKTERALKYISQTPKDTKDEKYTRTVKFRQLLPIANLKIKGIDSEYSVRMKDMRWITPKPGDVIKISYFKSEKLEDKTLQILDFKTDSVDPGNAFGTSEYEALKTSQQKFKKFLFYNGTETEFAEHLLKCGRTKTERLNQHFSNVKK